MTPRKKVSRDLLRLARLFGVQTWHLDGFGARHQPGEETFLSFLKALGADVESASQAGDAIRKKQEEIARRIVEPAQVSWADRSPEFRFSPPDGAASSLKLKLTLTGENGYEIELSGKLGTLTRRKRAGQAGNHGEEAAWRLPGDLPEDSYACRLEFDAQSHSSTLLRAPVQAADLPAIARSSRLGLFLPTYAIRSASSWGMGDYSDLAGLMNLARETGAGAVATLPLLPVFEDDPSPYSPVSRLAGNELYVDPRAAPEFGDCDAAQTLVQSREFSRRAAELDRAEFVDYAEQFKLRRPLLQAMADHAVATPRLQAELRRFAELQPRADEYARFRAACEKLGRPWSSWQAGPERGLRAGEHFDEASYNYHLNAQRLASDQVERLATPAGTTSPVLYLDMPLGVRGDGFDTWLNPGLFALGNSAGAPPDAFFTSGQNWGFPPIKPEALRQDGYRYLRESLRHIGSRSGIIRIDHVMSLHRLYWLPEGMDASDGAYVKYPAEEMYAVLALESNRTGTAVVGEDLGTVPRYVGPGMRRHNLFRMYATYFNVRPAERRLLVRPGREMFAYIDTHDMATFAAFVDGDDIGDRRDLGLLNGQQASSELRARRRAVSAIRKRLEADGFLESQETGAEPLLRAVLAWLRETDAAMLVVNLEDLWLEKRPQNTPGTMTERKNWRGRARLTLDEMLKLPADGPLQAIMSRVEPGRR